MTKAVAFMKGLSGFFKGKASLYYAVAPDSARAFSSEVDTGSREENAANQKAGARLIRAEKAPEHAPGKNGFWFSESIMLTTIIVRRAGAADRSAVVT